MTSSILEDRDGSILLEAQKLTHGDRNKDYGHPLDDYTKNAGMISALFAHKLKEPLTAADVALMMVCIKLSRQVHRPKRDNMVDAAGYAWVAQACVEETERRGRPTKPTTFKDIPQCGESPAGPGILDLAMLVRTEISQRYIHTKPCADYMCEGECWPSAMPYADRVGSTDPVERLPAKAQTGCSPLAGQGCQSAREGAARQTSRPEKSQAYAADPQSGDGRLCRP